jgi:hypothetical protein
MSSFFTLQKPSNLRCKIVYNIEEKNKFNLSIFKKYEENYSKVSSNGKDILRSSNIPIHYIAKQFYAFSFILNGAYILNDHKLYISVSNDATHYNLIDTISDIKENPKVDRLLMNTVSLSLFKEIQFFDLCEREKRIQYYKLTHISYVFNLLREGGTLFISVMNYCIHSTFEILYILTLMFEKVMIYKGTHICCYDFKANKSQITQKQFLQCIDHPFSITPKFQWKELTSYLEKSFKRYNLGFEMILHKKYDDYYYYEWKESMQLIKKKEKEEFENKTSYFFKDKINPYKTIIEFNKNIFMKFNKLFIGNQLVKFDIDSKLIYEIHEWIRTKNILTCLEWGIKDKGIFSFAILSVLHTKLYSNNMMNKELLKTYGFSKRHRLFIKGHSRFSKRHRLFIKGHSLIKSTHKTTSKITSKMEMDAIVIHEYESMKNQWIEEVIKNYGYLFIYKSGSTFQYFEKNPHFIKLDSDHPELFVFQKNVE